MKSTRIGDAPKFSPVKGALMELIGDGERMTFIRITSQPGVPFPNHSHHHEQIGTCIEGKGILSCGEIELEVKPGHSWVVSPNEIHKFVTGDELTIIYESWSPPREDYRELAKMI